MPFREMCVIYEVIKSLADVKHKLIVSWGSAVKQKHHNNVVVLMLGGGGEIRTLAPGFPRLMI